MVLAYLVKKFPRLSETFVLNEVLGQQSLGTPLHVFARRAPDNEPRQPQFAALAAPVELVPPSTKNDGQPGTRTQVSVVDFDLDGKLDLLVGDYRTEKNAAGKSAPHGYVWWFRRP